MSKVVVVTSGKGGVGKTTSTAALGAAIAQSGQSVVVVDLPVSSMKVVWRAHSRPLQELRTCLR